MFSNRDQSHPRGRHRKTRQPSTRRLIRGGLLSGVAGTVAVTGTTAATATATAEGLDESTAELPALTGGLDGTAGVGSAIADSASRAAVATRDYATEADAQQAIEVAERRAVEQAQREAAERREREDRREREEARRAAAAAAAEAAAEARRQAAAEAPAATAEAEHETAPEATAGSGTGAAAVVDYVLAQLGDGYAMGGAGPDAWDCSGLVGSAYATVGVSLPRTAAEQSLAGTQVSLDALAPGDVLYWGDAGSAYHIAIYVGDGSFIGAQNSSTGVVQNTLDWDPPSGAIRLL